MNKNYIKSLFTDEISYETDVPLIRKQILLSKLLFITSALFLTLAAYHFFLSHDISIVIIDSISFFAIVIATVALHVFKNFNSAVTISALTIFLFTIMFTIINKNSDYGLIWTIFFPMFTILTMGYKKSTIFIAIFYSLLFYIAYNGIGVWQDGNWDLTSFFHFALASALLTYTAYSIEFSQEHVHRELNALHVKEQKYTDELERLSVTDPLTSLHNRRYLEKVFKAEFYRAKRHSLVMAFFIVDIDFFKQYNDTYGHKAGDDVLVKVSSIMREHFKRHEDFIFRLGGEEFGGLITGENEKDVLEFTTALCSEIAKENIEHIGNRNQPILTISMGVKITKNFKSDDFNIIYKESDEALYEAKEGGRNKAVICKVT